LRTVLSDRRQLFDVGVAGPIAGFLVALPVLAAGLSLSHPVAPEEGFRGLVVYFAGGPQIPLGDSLITLLVQRLVLGRAAAVSVHPVAFAGWMGMLVTMLNLLPIAQLDGGHILYAALPRAQRQLARLFFVVVILLGFLSRSWFVWAFVVLLLSRGQFAHPPVLDAYRPLPKSRIWLLVASLVL